MIELTAYLLGRNDEEPNIQLAMQLAETENHQGISEIVEGLKDKRAQVANDCIKVLYEIGGRKPELIAGYADEFLSLLESKNNRLVWGAMTALAMITPLNPKIIYKNIESVKCAYKAGSVITIDNSISVFAELVKARVDVHDEIFNLILEHLSSCRPKEVPQHSERAFVCVTKENALTFKKVLELRMNELTETQKKRILKLSRKIEQLEKEV